MEKPIVFLSHSSRDEKPLKVLKTLLHKKTGGALTLFLSSDGQSIPLGRNWVHELQQSLDKSHLMFVFASPDSLRSSWIHFEAGYAYSKGVRVVPVGILGLDLEQVAPPLSLLQGFNVTSEAGLNNLIALVNQVFEHNHEESFTRHEYESIFSDAGYGKSLAYKLNGLVEDIKIDLEDKTASELDVIEQCLKSKAIEYTREENKITTYGLIVSANTDYSQKYKLSLSISSELAGATLPVVGEFVSSVLGGSGEALSVTIELSSAVEMRRGHQNVTARLFGTNILLGGGETLRYRDYTFSLNHYIHFLGDRGVKQGAAYVKIDCEAGQLQSLDIEGLLDILLTRGVIFLVEPVVL